VPARLLREESIGYQVVYSENHERGGVINRGINSKMRRNSLAAVGRVRIIVSTVFARTGSKRGMTLTRPFQPEVTEADRVLRIFWDNRRCPRDNGHLVTLILLQSLIIPPPCTREWNSQYRQHRGAIDPAYAEAQREEAKQRQRVYRQK